MIIHYPLGTHPGPATSEPSKFILRPTKTAGDSWRYDGSRRSRSLIAIAMLISASLHVGLFFGIRKSPAKAPVAAKEEFVIRLTPMPEIKDLEEPETVASDDGPPPDLSTLVPMQQDVPQLPQPSDFVQQVNYATLLEQPDFSQMKLSVIPQNMRTGMNLAEKIGRIFNPEDLDRAPEPVLQPAPVYPHAMKREGIHATVLVEFVVDSEGRVLAPFIVDSTHHSFDDAALAGVARWKFRAGIRGGKKVPSRMRVPIVFKTVDVDI